MKEARAKKVDWHPYVVESEEFRELQFGDWDVQSKMCKAAPNELVLGYTQAMMGFMLFHPEPRDVLIAGLGGGSLSKFCHLHLPNSRITTVEISQEVIALRNDFCIPQDSERFRIIHDDIASYLDGKDAIADVILLDGYDQWGIPTSISDQLFYSSCMRAIREGGMLVANLNLGAMSIAPCAKRLLELYKGRDITIRSFLGYNDIFFGFQDDELPDLTHLKQVATTLTNKTGVDFLRVLGEMRVGTSWSRAVASS